MNTFKVITYNIDGLPESLDLNELPWIFKPIVWIYKLIKGTTIININDNGNKKEDTRDISQMLFKENADVIAFQEDFNYHKELVSALGIAYSFGTHSGTIDPKRIFSDTEWLSCFPLPRFLFDGLNIATKNETVGVTNEIRVEWNKSYGYFTHANDKLTHKGFRFYPCVINHYSIDVYIIHMDADFYDPIKCPDCSQDMEARISQFKQLTDYILKLGRHNPIIIMGDTNTDLNKILSRELLVQYLCEPFKKAGFNIERAIPSNYNYVDMIFYIDNPGASYYIKPIECKFLDYGNKSDHSPLMAIFDIIDKTSVDTL